MKQRANVKVETNPGSRKADNVSEIDKGNHEPRASSSRSYKETENQRTNIKVGGSSESRNCGSESKTANDNLESRATASTLHKETKNQRTKIEVEASSPTGEGNSTSETDNGHQEPRAVSSPLLKDSKGECTGVKVEARSGIMNGDQQMRANVEVIDVDAMYDEEDDDNDSVVYVKTIKPSVTPAKRKREYSVLEMQPPFDFPEEPFSDTPPKSKFRPIAHPSAKHRKEQQSRQPNNSRDRSARTSRANTPFPTSLFPDAKSFARSANAAGSSNVQPEAKSRKKNQYNYKEVSSQGKYYYSEDAEAEQERLFREAAERVRRAKLNESRARLPPSIPPPKRQQTVFFRSPVQDLSTLPDCHWKWSDPYSRLGLPRRASIDLVKKHYRRLALLWHPDKSRRPDALKRFHAIKEAYETLTNDGA